MRDGGIFGCFLITLILLLGGTLTPDQQISTGSAWLSGWSNRFSIIIDHTKIASNVQDFPVLIHLNEAAGINSADTSSVFDDLQNDADRKKIAVVSADSAIQCYVEIDEWSSQDREAWLWVKIPVIYKSKDTTLYLYYDSHHEDNAEWVGDSGSLPAQKVWDSHFVGVWHLAQDGKALTGEQVQDSTAKLHDGIKSDLVNTPTMVNAKIGYGQLFDSIDDYIQIPDSQDFSVNTTGDLTVSFWLSPSILNFGNQNAEYVNFLSKGDIGHQEWQFVMYDQSAKDRSQWVSFYVYSPSGGLGAGGYSSGAIEVGSWVYITGKTDSIRTYLYRNGFYFNSDPWYSYSIQYAHGPAPVRIGTQNTNRDSGCWHGRIDEFRISNVSRSDAWIQASYYSENDNLLKLSSFITQSPVLSPIGDKSIVFGNTLTIKISADILSGKTLVYSASNLPPGAEFDPSTATFSWTPAIDQIDVYPDVRFSVTDGNLTDYEDITITVLSTQPQNWFIRYLIIGLSLILIGVGIFYILHRRRLRSKRTN